MLLLEEIILKKHGSRGSGAVMEVMGSQGDSAYLAC